MIEMRAILVGCSALALAACGNEVEPETVETLQEAPTEETQYCALGDDLLERRSLGERVAGRIARTVDDDKAIRRARAVHVQLHLQRRQADAFGHDGSEAR